jgi:serine/threonine-protein kinase
VGRKLNGRYEVTRFIASGGMAQVWEADDAILARRVAVKVLHPAMAADTQFVSRFRAEAIAAARLSHPAIVSIYDTWTDDGLEAIVMELVRGSTLRGLLDTKKRLDITDAVAIAGHVADALSAAHEARLIHRDVKPANVLLSDDGRVLVTDFGIAKAMESADVTKESVLLGTAKYLAPEQVEGKRVDARSDIYSLGVVLYEMLCGQPPFIGESDAATALARLHRDPTPSQVLRPDLPYSVINVLDQSLARDPERRFRTATDMQRALMEARRGLHTGATPLAAPPAAPLFPNDTPPAARLPSPPPPAYQERYPTYAPATAMGSAPPPGGPPSQAAERRWLVPVALGTVIIIAVAAVGLLLANRDPDDGEGRRREETTENGEGTASSQVDPAQPAQISEAFPFDPEGDGRESDKRIAEAVDGKLDTAWRTERYTDAAIRVKSGVGMYVTLTEATKLSQLVIESPSSGWTAAAYVVEGAPGKDIGAWGEPLGKQEDIPEGTATFDLQGRKGSAVLLWITHVGTANRVDISEIKVEAAT